MEEASMSTDFQIPQGYQPVAAIGVDARATFINRTYNHLMGAIVLFTLIEVALFQSGYAESIARVLLGGSWLLVLGAFMLVSWFASRISLTSESKGAQYAALGGFVVAESIIFVPMLWLADQSAPGAIQSAAVVTLVGFAGLTAVAFVTRKDFSFLRGMLMWGGIVALLAIVGGVLFGFALGTWFSVAMIGFAGAAILYDTSNVLHHYPEDRYVGAALQLFASVALMFWYVLRLFMSKDD
jgi:FtsH-binding integral membrane protein